MAVTSRLHELRAEGKHELADTLAAEALRNETPSVTVKTDHVRVETPTFVGEHALATGFDATDEATVRDTLAREGRYSLVGDDSGHTFTTGCLYDAVVDQLLDAPAATDRATEAAERGDDAQTIAPDGDGTGDVDPVTPVETTRGPASVIRQAVAAVQNQFRS
ncbi:hypothetical protein ACFPYI_02065 [Halomarina salina]|uniref:Uncharacterized protein n=1 Tax=Halomarina salina TaxID=1872699 RepID=A0ABD5RHP1_9EURY|nr:hypothetical protein [Halomarina salina]